MSALTDVVRAGLEAIGATGLVCTEIPCGCGLDDLMPCDEPCPRWEAAGRRHAKADVQLAQEANDEGRLF